MSKSFSKGPRSHFGVSYSSKGRDEQAASMVEKPSENSYVEATTRSKSTIGGRRKRSERKKSTDNQANRRATAYSSKPKPNVSSAFSIKSGPDRFNNITEAQKHPNNGKVLFIYL